MSEAPPPGRVTTEGTVPSEVEALRHEVRRLRRLVVGTGIALLVMALAFVAEKTRTRHDLASVTTTETLTPGVSTENQALVIRDDKGTVRTRLDTTGLWVYDEAGTARIQALLSEGTALFTLASGTNPARLQLATAEDGHVGLYFYDKRMRHRARLSLGADGLVGFTLFDDNFVWRAVAAVTTENVPSFTIYDGRGRVVSRMPPEPRDQAAAPDPMHAPRASTPASATPSASAAPVVPSTGAQPPR